MNLYEAIDAACIIHAGQVDKAGRPYIGHLFRTMLRLPADATELEMKAALLHDALEDSGKAMYNKLVEMGAEPELMEMLEALNCKAWNLYSDYIERVAKSPAWRVKLADIEDNADLERLALVAKTNPGMAARLEIKYQLARAAILGANLSNG